MYKQLCIVKPHGGFSALLWPDIGVYEHCVPLEYSLIHSGSHHTLTGASASSLVCFLNATPLRCFSPFLGLSSYLQLLRHTTLLWPGVSMLHEHSSMLSTYPLHEAPEVCLLDFSNNLYRSHQAVCLFWVFLRQSFFV